MNLNRKNFITSFAAAGVGSVLAGKVSAATPNAAKLSVPDGKVFEGMSGAYSAMYTPFFRDGEKAGGQG